MTGRTECEWAILVPTIPRRRAQLERLLSVLLPQVADWNGMVHVVGWLNTGQPRIAEIRDDMLTYADDVLGAEYVSFVDDDDMISEDYVYEIMKAINSGRPDHIGFWLDYWKDGQFRSRVEHSFRHSAWGHSWGGRPYGGENRELKLWRDFTHIDPMKTSWARKGRFVRAGKMQAEDRKWCRQLRDRGFSRAAGATEVFIDRSLYTYLWVPGESAWDEAGDLNGIGDPARPHVDSPYFTWHPRSL